MPYFCFKKKISLDSLDFLPLGHRRYLYKPVYGSTKKSPQAEGMRANSALRVKCPWRCNALIFNYLSTFCLGRGIFLNELGWRAANDVGEVAPSGGA